MPVKLGTVPQHGFDQPLGLLSDCHRRIENFLAGLRKILDLAGDGPLRDEHRAAAETALTYFRTAAPRHNQDEEVSLFPLLRQSDLPAARAALAAVDALEADHATAEPAHQRVDQLYRQWIDAGSLPAPDRIELARLLDGLIDMYRRHIGVEDTQIFPLAARVLTAEQLGQVGSEMAERRGVRGLSFAKPRAGAPATAANATIDVRTIPGPQRHPLIFKTFESLQVGQALEIVNDHDPFPLHNQFNFMKKGQFSWDYLQQGPDLWRVRIARIAP